MKIVRTAGIIFAVGLLFASAVQTFAIEGIKLSVQSRNVILSWPSVAGETYIVQYRQTLDATNSWQTLANYYPAFSGTNQTTFVHSNQLSFSVNIDGYSSSGSLVASAAVKPSLPPVPLAMPTNGSSAALPVAIYPPGFDLSGYIIFDPTTKEQVNGSEYTARPLSLNDTQPFDSGSGGRWTVQAPETGFYRIVCDGVHLFGITNGITLSGEVKVPIEYSLDSTNEIAGVTFYANGSPLIGASAIGAGGRWILDWNTRMMNNGNYNITAEIDFVTDNPVASVPVAVTVTNTISFPNYFTRIFGNRMWVYAKTLPYVSYEIDIYDENTNFLGYFADYTGGNGTISFLWDLTDGNGHTFESTNYFGLFTVDITSQTALNANPENKPLAETAFGIYGANERNTLMGHLGDPGFRNFYYFGHGSPYAIGGVGVGSVTTYTDIVHALNNLFITTKPTNLHPYRFVFIDGCSAGEANFCEAFGIPAQPLNNAFFSNAGVRSRAFIGFRTQMIFNPQQWPQRANMLANFWNDWVIQNLPLQTCVDNAVNFGTGALDSSVIIYGAANL
jgi:hypothetical protein